MMIIVALLILPLAMIVIALIQNHLPWRSEPGVLARLNRYLASNEVSTTPESAYPELITHHYLQPKAAMLEIVEQAVKSLGWSLQVFDPKKIHAVVTTPMLKFKDDVYISLTALNDEQTSVDIRSVSRAGKGDLGTNTRHILNLYRQIDEQAR